MTQDTRTANKVGLNQTSFDELGISEGELVQVSQGNLSVHMPATLEKALAMGVVRISAGTMASAQLGPMFGSVTVSRA